jgi:N-acetylgalactosamine-6-sulfatase
MHDTATGVGYGIGAAKGITGGRKGYKATLFEGGVGVPFIARWPGRIAAGRVDNQSIFSAVDLFPTFCELAGAPMPKDFRPDGISQIATLKGKGKPLRTKPLFWKMKGAWPSPKSRPYHWVSYAIVHQNWKMMTNSDFSYVELYDISADPLERNDLSNHKVDVTKNLLQQIAEWKETLPAKPTGKVFSRERNRTAKNSRKEQLHD